MKLIKHICILVCFIIVFLTEVHSQGQWVSMDGPYFATVRALAIDPHNPDVIYAGAIEAGGGLFKSIDGGMSWEYLPPSLGTYAIAIDPQNNDRIYASKSRSVDGGSTWEYMDDLKIWDSWALAVDPINTNIVYAGDMLSGGIWKSLDYGENWDPINEGIPTGFPNGTIHGIAINPQNPSTLIITTLLDGIYKSYDGGESWIHLGFGKTLLDDVVFDWYDTTVVYLAAGQVFKSSDSGLHWTSLGLSGIEKIVVDPIDHQTIYAGGSGNGIYVSTNGGVLWTDITNELSWLSNDVLAIAVNPTDNSEVCIGTGIGVYQGTTDFYHWQQRFTGLNRAAVNDIDIVGDDLYVASIAGNFRYTDAGEWYYKGLFDTRFIRANPEEPDILLSTENTVFDQRWLYRSSDHGNTWSRVDHFSTPYTLPIAIAPSDPNRVYAGRLRSDDKGATWDTMSTDLSGYTALVVHPEFRDVLYVGNKKGVYKSINGGTSWDTLAFPDTNNPKILTIDPQNGENIYVGVYYHGIYKCTDGGVEWNAMNSGLENLNIRAIDIHPLNSDHIYAGTYGGGVFFSENGGVSWDECNVGLPSLYVKALTVDTAGVFVGFEELKGVYRKVITTQVVGNQTAEIPLDFIIFPNYPNPFNDQTHIDFQVPVHSHVRLKIYNVLGQEVKTLENRYFNKGLYRIIWDGKNDKGQSVGSGIYLCNLEGEIGSKTCKLILLR
jgi:photosystem II stability/assembly factor-like uncharacterized protein